MVALAKPPVPGLAGVITMRRMAQKIGLGMLDFTGPGVKWQRTMRDGAGTVAMTSCTVASCGTMTR